MSSERVFAIIVPSEASLTVSIAPSVELSKLYIMAAKKVQQLEQQTRLVHDTGDDGVEHTRVIDHPDLKWWFDQCRRIGAEIAKLMAAVEGKDVENKIRLMDVFLNSDSIPQDQREAFAKLAIERKIKGITYEPITPKGTGP